MGQNYTDVVNLYRDQGVVLRTIKLGETDRIVTILTQGHGKIRAVAKGVRKPGSRFGARLEPTSHVALQIYRGRELDIVTQTETIDANRALREHYGCLTHSVSMLEATDQVAQEREANPALYRMLVGASAHPGREPQPAGERRLLLEAALPGGLPPDARHVRPLRRRVRAVHRLRPRRGWRPLRRLREASPAAASSPTPSRWSGGSSGGELRSALAEPPSATTVETERLALTSLEHHLERRLRSAALL